MSGKLNYMKDCIISICGATFDGSDDEIRFYKLPKLALLAFEIVENSNQSCQF